MNKATPVLVIGIGNPFRSDDRAGLEVAQQLKRMGNDRLKVLEVAGNPLTLLDLWKGYDEVLLVDAVSSKSKPGTFQIINAAQQEIPAGMFNTSTHNMSVAESIEMARNMSQLPERLLVYGIEGENFQFGETLSAHMDGVIEEVVGHILSQIH
jgi:hydrogenase maturation protease